MSHPDVIVDPATPVERWHLSPVGIARMRTFAALPWLAEIASVWASTETKAIEAAGILAAAIGCGVGVDAALGENDRRSTGFLPPFEFEHVADGFFAEPQISVRGWERAVDAQRRVLGATRAIVGRHRKGDLAIVAHGAVGTLLFCALSDRPISRSLDQPSQGHYWCANLHDLKPHHGWRRIAARM